jgi:hypothetical protein
MQVKEDALRQVTRRNKHKQRKMYPTMNIQSTMVLFAIVAAIGLVTVVAVDIILTAQEAEAKGCPATSPAANASKTRCFRG